MINQALSEGLSRDDLSDIPTSIDSMDQLQAVPADHFFELHEILDHLIGPGFSVRVGKAMEMDDYGVLGLSWKTCSTAGEIFERSERYFLMLSNTYVFKVEEEGDVSHIYLNREAHRRGVELSNEATFAATVVVMRAMTEKKLSPINVCFKHSEPRDLTGYEEVFECPIHFNVQANILSYKTTDFNTRTAKADASINQFLLERVEEETKGIEIGANRVAADVTQLIQEALPSGIPSIAQVGEHMGMSNRTLTRRLSETGVSFRDLIQQTQEDLAKDLLKDPSRGVAEIAFQTGFSEQSAFNRAFKRWTGLSPLDYRKK